MPPWSYRIFEPNTTSATVRVRLFAASLPSQVRADELIEALVEIPWQEDRDELTISARRHIAATGFNPRGNRASWRIVCPTELFSPERVCLSLWGQYVAIRFERL